MELTNRLAGALRHRIRSENGGENCVNREIRLAHRIPAYSLDSGEWGYKCPGAILGVVDATNVGDFIVVDEQGDEFVVPGTSIETQVGLAAEYWPRIVCVNCRRFVLCECSD
jgi:hypothetical protein